MGEDIFVVIEHLRGGVADISYSNLAMARSLAHETSCQVTAILLGYGAQMLASDLAADKVFYVDHSLLMNFSPDAYIQVLADLIRGHSPRIVLLGETAIGSEVAGLLSARLDLPQVSYCQRVYSQAGSLKFTSKICGGKIIAEGQLPDSTTLITTIPGQIKPEEGRSARSPEIISIDSPHLEQLRIVHKQFIEPEPGDIDISKEDILVSIGRGIQNQDNIQVAQDLAEVLNCVVCSSRPVVDQGWLPTTRLVGKSGKRIKPKLYLALGISGAPEHVEAITGSQTIIAINTDIHAPIFNVADYGAVIDMFDLIPVLIEKLQMEKTIRVR